jgi:tRNA (guanine37-N1)-methyltransferase
MRFDIITVLPELLESPLNHSIMKRAKDKGHLEVHLHSLRDFAEGKYKQVDDYQFGGGAGMVMRCEPIAACIEHLMSERKYDEIIYVTPDGKTLNQSICNKLSMQENILILCGHYKGVDQRIRDKYITLEISIGDYVLSGGELAAAIIVDSVGRLIPGVLNDETSALFDSFQDNLLAPPVYTRPAEWEGMKIPEVLLSGHDLKIEEWRFEQSLARTKERRPDLL